MGKNTKALSFSLGRELIVGIHSGKVNMFYVEMLILEMNGWVCVEGHANSCICRYMMKGYKNKIG